MACGCGGSGTARRQTFRIPAEGNAQAAQAATAVQHEVLNARGTPTGRKFSSLVAATGYAQRIGGSVRPA